MTAARDEDLETIVFDDPHTTPGIAPRVSRSRSMPGYARADAHANAEADSAGQVNTMTLTTLALYSLACLAVFITPGPTTLLAFSNGTRKNWHIVAMGILGASLSDVLLIGAVGLGLGALLAASELLFTAVKALGVVYLAWLGVQLWRSRPAALSETSPGPDASPSKAFWRSLFVALSNPKALLFFAAFLPQFIDTAHAQAPQYAVLALVSAALDMLVMAVYAMGGTQAARLLSARGIGRLHRGCAVAMFSLAGFLALYRRAEA